MKLFEVRDVVREQVGRDALDEPTLDWCIRRGLRELEKRDNFYWMDASAKFHIYAEQQEYVVQAGDGLNIPDLKDIATINISDQTATAPTWCEVTGPEDTKVIKTSFTDTDSGPPAFWSMDGLDDEAVLKLWPPYPETAYLAEVFYWRWTELPTDVRSDKHEVLRRWPEALIYLATEQGILVSKKDVEQAMFWRSLFDNPNQLINTEYKRIKIYQKERKNQKRFRDSPINATSTNSDKLLTRQKAWF